MKDNVSYPKITVLLRKHKGEFRLCLVFDFCKPLIKIIRTLPNTKWSAQMTCWHMPYSSKNIALIKDKLTKITQVDLEGVTSKKPLKLKLTTKEKQTLRAFYIYLKGKRYSESTLKTYTYLIGEFMYYHKKERIASVREIEEYIEKEFMKKNPSISTHRQFISSMNHFLVFTKADFSLDFKSIAPKKDKKLPQVLSKEEIITLLQVTKNLKHRVCIALLYSSGLRVGELLRLKLEDIDFHRRLLRVAMSKGRKDRYVPLATSILPMLQNYLQTYQPKTYVIENDNLNKPFAATSVRSFLARCLKKANIKKRVTPHTLRHSYATHLLESGTDIRYIQSLLGHSKPETTMIYTHVQSDAIKAINNPLDLIVAQFKNSNKLSTFKPEKNI